MTGHPRAALASVALALLACVAPAGGHEIGTTRVSVLFQDARRYDIHIVTDAAALLEKLGVTAGPDRRTPAFAGSGAGAVRERIAALENVFRQRIAVAFDGAAAHPSIQYALAPAEDAASPIVATIRLTGDVPAGARLFTWKYSWTFATYALSVKHDAATDTTVEWLEGGQTSAPFSLTARPAAPDRVGTVRRYLVLGFTHIVPHGLDHMLFVLGIFLLNRRARSVLTQVSAFTLAHSITLGLSIHGLIDVPAPIVEPLIAVSIAYVAIENLLLTDLKPSRVVLVFVFGLLHGMGFAGVLQDAGLPRTEFMTALLAFNIGVEAGQLAVIAAAWILVGRRWGNRSWYRARIVVPASLLIACVAVYWTVERAGL